MELRRVQRSPSKQRTGSVGYRTYIQSVSIFACPKPRKVRRLATHVPCINCVFFSGEWFYIVKLISFPGARLYVQQCNRIIRISM